ncbi:hypothetical protein EDB19DRAFT_1633777, partial [Suillus lakei]
PSYPICLSLALNFSIFYFEILNSLTYNCCLTKWAFGDVIAELVIHPHWQARTPSSSHFHMFLGLMHHIQLLI